MGGLAQRGDLQGERLVVGMLEQPLVQPLGVTGQVVGEHVECSAQWQRPLAHVHIQDCLADICSGDIEHAGFLAPNPRRVVTVVSPPVNDTCFHSLVVTDVGVRNTTVDTGPAVTLPGVRLQHQRRVRLGVRDTPVAAEVVVGCNVVIESFCTIRIKAVSLSSLPEELLARGDL